MEELLLKLKELGVGIKVVDERLKITVPEGFNNPDIISELTANKSSIINYVNSMDTRNRKPAGIPKAVDKEFYPLTSPQLRLFLLDQINKSSLAYNQTGAIRINGALDNERLNFVFRALVRRHESFRMSFGLNEYNEPVFRVLPEVDFQLEILDAGPGIETTIHRFIRPFDLKNPPLLRAGVVKQGVEGPHYVLLDMHHIACDGVSLQTIIREFTQLYRDAELPALKRQYKDYAEYLSGAQYKHLVQKQKDFWVQEFNIDYSPLNLPCDFPRPKEKTFAGRVAKFSITGKEKMALESFCRENDITPYTVLLSAFSILLSKLSGSNDVVVGTMVAGRKYDELEGIVGMFAKTLALPVSIKSQLAYNDFVKQLHQKVLHWLDNDDYPYEELINELHIDRDRSRNPLFDCLFVLQNIRQEHFEMDDAEIQRVSFESTTSKFDMVLEASEEPSAIHFDLEYSTDLFTSATIERFIGFYKTLLKQLVQNQEKPLSELSLLSEQEEQALLTSGNNGATYPVDSTIVGLFEEQVKRTPGSVAVVFGEETLTYSALNNLANILAYELRSHGVGRGDIIGLFTDKNRYTVAAMLGILKAGGAYLPLDPAYPEGRINYMLENSKIKLLVTDHEHQSQISDGLVEKILLDDVLNTGQEVPDVPRINQPEDLCYIIYTSGTTGNPKGVMIEHRNLVRLLFNDSFQFSFGVNDVWTMFHSHCFDFSVWEMYGALLFGGRVVVVPQQVARDPARYIELLSRHKVSVLNQTPTAFNNLVEELGRSGTELPALRYVIFGGEALVPAKLRSWFRQYPAVKLVNMYGITEVTVHATYKEIGEQEIEKNISNIGTAIPTTSLYVLDENKKLVPPGVTGEIYVGGAGISRGYLNNEPLTLTRFFDNPYRTGERLYRSGDLGRLLPNGDLEYLGRIDDQVQLHGFRIELKEIEHHLLRHEAVKTGLVIKQEPEEGHAYLCAYYISDEELDVAELRAYLGNFLPAYMVPSYFVKLEEFPMTSNNKIAVSRLPLPNREQLGGVYSAPVTLEESVMAQVWETVLRVPRVGTRDNYFNLGGDSLMAIGLIAGINSKLSTSLTIADLYSNQTIESLAELVTELKTNNAHGRAVEAAREEIREFQENYIRAGRFLDEYESVYPMNGVEKGMVFHSLKVKPKNVHEIIYHEQNIYDCTVKNFDFTIFRQAVDLMIQKHATLRKVYDLEYYAHLIKKEIEPEVNFTDISHLDKQEQEAFIKNKMLEEKMRMTNLSFSLLWRINIIKINDDFQYMLFDFHHSLFDGWSLSSFLTELINFYSYLDKDSSYTPKLLQSTYEDQITGELAAARNESSIQYWKDELDGYTRFELPSSGEKHEFASDWFEMGPAFRTSLEALAVKYNTSFKHLCFAAYIYSLNMLSYKDDITTGIVTNNRPVTSDGDRLLGCFLNTIPFRAKIPQQVTWGGYIEFIENRLRKLKYHERVPIYKILEITGESSSERNPFFDISFNYIDFRIYNEIAETDSLIKPSEFKESNFYLNNNTKLDFHIYTDNGDFRLALTYSAAVFSKKLIKDISHYFRATLTCFLKNENEIAGKDVILPDADKAILQKANQLCGATYPIDSTIVGLFEEQVKRTPGSVAVVFGEETLTYSALNNLANILAYELRSHGVGPGDIIGLFTDKNRYTVAAMLGILKAGGAYLPLDPAYPEGRINYMLENSKIKLLVTDHEHQSQISDGLVEKILLDDVLNTEQEVPDVPRINQPEDLCYIIYTSGTTGNPKGVMIEHRNLVRLLFNDSFQFSFGVNDVWTMFHSHCFDFSVWEMYGALLFGGKVVVVPQQVARDPARYIELLSSHKVSVLNQTPTAFNNLVEELGRSGTELPALRYVIFGGEALVPAKLRSWFRQYPAVKLVNMYGITEVTVHATYKEIGEQEIEKNISNIGTAIPTTSLYVLDENKKLVPPGVTGEIYVGGAGISRGYLNNEPLTLTRFFDNPYRTGERLYRSGDLGRLLPNGDLEYLGRIDDQVQLHGFRIELKEIEHHLLRHEAVKTGLVIKQEPEEGHAYLCAYYISDEELDVAELRAYLSNFLPAYMVPSYFVKLEEFPMTSNNKIAVSRLPLPNREQLGGVYSAPVTPEESVMAQVWETVLRVPRVGTRDNYFNLGGDSLMAIGLIAGINSKLSTSLTIADLYSNQTIESLAELVTELKTNNAHGRAVEAAREEIREFRENYIRAGRFLDEYESVYPMNGVEKGMVFEYLKTKPTNVHEIIYHEQNMYDYPARNFDFSVFRHALDLMIQKHPALRKVYDLEYFAHLTKKKIEPEVNFTDISHLDRQQQEAFIKNKMLEEKMRMTSMSFSLLWRINMIKVRPDFQYMLFDFHHSLFDGWSLSSFLTELLNMYSYLLKDGSYTPKPLQSTYEDQITGELAAARNESSIQYWKDELDGYTRFELPSTGDAHEFISDVFELGVDFRDQLETLAVKYNTSFKHLCFAAYIYTMNMLSYEDDITVGMVTNNRPLTSDGERLLGCFLNTIPFRAKIPQQVTWGGYIEFIENKLRKLKYHERVPFYKILEITGEQASERNPVFDVAFNYLDFKIFQEWEAYDSATDFEENSLSEFFLNEHFPFGFHIEAHDIKQQHGGVYNKSFRLLLRYSTAIFSKKEIKKLSVYFKTILEQFLYNETAPVSKATIMLAEKDDQALLKQYNDTQVEYEQGITCLDLFSKQVQQRPDHIAVVFEDKQLTYRELDERSWQLARILLKKGVTAETLVPLCVDRSLEMIIGILGILKAGCAYVPIDPEYPGERIGYILEDTRAAVVLTVRKYKHLFSGHDPVLLDNKTVYRGKSRAAVGVNISAGSLAYVIYTSGTTGRPKGVMNQHDGLYNRLVWMKEYLGATQTDNILQKTTFCFDVSVWELLLPLTIGARLTFAAPDGHKDPAYLWELINSGQVTIMHFVPSMLSVFLSGFSEAQVCGLRAVVCSGEELKAHTVKDFQHIFPTVKLYNLYGPTEAAIDVTATELSTYSGGPVTIGKPIANVQIYIADSRNNLQPAGVPGEILIGGIQVARGYLNKPELTAEKFIANPFDKNDPYKLYKTGDIGRWLPGGNIEYAGRKDDQVKIRGFRIELGEIQNQLVRYPGISEAIVIAVHRNDGAYLAAYYVSETALDALELQQHLRHSLPEYMIPLTFLHIHEIPLTANGKADRAKLPSPDITTEEIYIAPSNSTEERLAVIWAEALDLEKEKISTNRSFFDLGGNSLTVVHLVSLIRREFSAELAIRDIFEYSTIASLAEHILQQSPGSGLPPITPVIEKTGRTPLSYGQERLWFIDKLQGSEAYHIPTVLKLSGDVDPLLLEKSFRALVERHEVLHTIIMEEEGNGYQLLIPPSGWKLEQLTADTKDELDALLAEHGSRPFVFSRDYMFRACLCKCKEDSYYYLSFVVHHIASDGWSDEILVKEFIGFYNAFRAGRDAGLPELKIQYRDYAIWQRNYVTGDYLETQLQYWEKKLLGYHTLNLPVDYSRPPVQSMNGANISIQLDEELCSRLKQLCRSQGVTLYMLLLSAFKVLLYRYSGQEDIVVGTPVANRTQEELEALIGFFVNTLVIRTELSGNMSFAELLQQVKTTALEAYDHQEVPFEKIVDRVVKERDMSISPLFQVMFSLQNISGATRSLQADGIAVEPYDQEMQTSQFDLSLSVEETNGRISCHFNYCTDLFEPATIGRMARHYEQLLRSVVQNSGTAIAALELVTREEKQQLLYGFNNTTVSYPDNSTFLDLFEEQVQQHPDNVAVVFEDKQLTYRELDERSDQLAVYLQKHGVKPETLVPICVDRSLEMITGILGILKAGGAYVPIDPEYPNERISYILEDTRANMMICNGAAAEKIRSIIDQDNRELVWLDKDWPLIAGQATVSPAKMTGSGSLAYVIYTSGTTGRPKGVMIEHGSLYNLVRSVQAEYGITGNDRILQFVSISFDMSVEDIFPYLASGAGVVLTTDAMHRSPEEFFELCAQNNITILNLPPSFWQEMTPEHLMIRFQLPGCIRLLVLGGDRFPRGIVTGWRTYYPELRLINAYGPTEYTVNATFYNLPSQENHPGRQRQHVSIGKPISNTRIYIMGEGQQLVPPGVPGELCVSGLGLARGYLGKPELTAEKFINNPFDKNDPYKLYKTGDIGRWLPDGNIELLGRADDQVKIRGYRIEPGEIETALNEMENIQASCVLARKDKAGNNRLVGYIVSSSPIEKDKLEAELKKKLPDYMVPRLWVFMEELPVTSNGKIDKKALPDPDLSELVNRQYVAPRNAAEQRLAGIWQQVLGLERVGVHDNFFELGGHSLLVTRLVSLIRREFSAELAIRDIFEYSTIASLAEHILQQSPGSGLPPITPVIEKTGRTPLSYGQERLWFIDKLQGSEAYHIHTVLKLIGEVDGLLLEKSFRALVERHEVLHTIIVEEEGSGYQLLIPPSGWKLEQLTADTKEELDTLLAEHGSRPFVFSRDYMFRACLCKCKEDGYYYLSFVVHHIASDGWSDEILVKEFIGFYNAFRAGRDAGLPALKIQYRDYAIWQRNHVTGDYLENQLQYWEKKLLGYHTLNLPVDYSRPPVQSMNGANTSIRLDEELCTELKRLCRTHGVTLYMLLLSAFKVLLYRYSGQEDIVVGTPVANRTQEDLEALIGFFVNTLVIRTELSGNMSFTELLQQVKTTALEAYDHQEVPFEKIVDRVVKERDMSISPLFQVMFSLQAIDKTSRNLQADGIAVEPYDRDRYTAQFDLSLLVEEMNGKVDCYFNYSTDLFAPATIERMAGHYEQLLRSVVKNSSTAIAALELVTKEEKQQLLYGFNNTAVSYPANRTFLNLFEEQVQQHPDNIAVVFEGKTLTYRELDERSGQLSLYLQKHGVKPDTLVPLCVDRSLEMITGILGILKAGCAYVPIDPEYPSERISYILEDTRATVVVTVSKYEHLFTANDPVLLDNQSVYRSKIRADRVVVSSKSLAYVIYTSGTTGRPKGVMNQHDGLYNRLVWMKDYIGATPADNVLQKTTFCFDVSVWELLFPLTIGARLIFAAPDGHKDPAYLWELINSGQVTIMHFVPSMLSVFLSGFSEVQSCGLRAVVCSGEELKAHTVKDFQHIFPTVKLYNLYGPTEAAIEVTATDLSAYSGGPVTIGKPIANVQIYIADSRNNLQPAGVPGEILIGGIQVARGYLNKPELTAEKFIDNPFDKNDPHKLYKTGDIGRWLPDGNIEYAGRKDDQVKIRGFRIELGEVEAALNTIEEVKTCCVLARKDKAGNNRLVGYIVSSSPIEKDMLEAELKKKLPDYMVPQLWVFMEELPITANGKTDKKALPDPDLSELVNRQYVAPRNPAEQRLAGIWQQVLGLERIGVHDNFFELGGHSLLVTRLVSLIRREFSAELAIRDIFEYSTIASLAEHILQQSPGSGLPPITPVIEKTGRTPLSYGQERLWFIDKLQGSEAYHIPTVLKLSGDVDPLLLEKSFRALVERHEVLHTIIMEEEGSGYQSLIDPLNWKLEQLTADTKEELDNLLAEHGSRPFVFSRDYMFRACLCRCKEDGYYYLSFVVHHIASDGWSDEILVKEFIGFYNAFRAGREAGLPELKIQYRDYAIWQRNYVTGDYLETQLQYWEKKLLGYHTLNLPVDYSRPPVQSMNGANISIQLDEELCSRLKQLCRSQGVTLYMLLLSAFKVLLYRYSGQEDITVGTPVANRTQEELEALIGFFVNTLVIRTELSGNMSFTELLQQVKTTALEAYDHQEVPFEKIVDRVVKERDMSISPLFQVMFSLQTIDKTSRNLQADGIMVEPYDQEMQTSQFDLSLSVEETNGQISCHFNYCTDLFEPATIGRMARHYVQLLRSVVQNSNAAIAALELVTREEKQQLLYGFNNTTVNYPANSTFLDLFDEQVQQHPDNIAVVFEGKQLTYRELDERSSQLALYLQKHGVKPETLVPLCVDRSLEMITGILGILKAGCAYVPIDPEYPSERISYILYDTRATVVVTVSKYEHLFPGHDPVLLDNKTVYRSKSRADRVVVSSSSLAYVIYTSGTTGTPKGVMIEHGSLYNLIRSMQAEYGITGNDRILQFASISFDMSVEDIFPYLASGAGVVLTTDAMHRSPEEFFELCAQNNITILNLPPSFWQEMTPEHLMIRFQLPGCIRLLVLGGDRFPRGIVTGWRTYYPELRLINAYGPTEYTVNATFYNLPSQDEHKGRQRQHVSIGKPISNTRIYIMGEGQQLVPPGVPGELCVSGLGLARGYLNNPALTSEKFVPDPFVSNERMYKTGDIGRWLPDGNIELLGRADDQVKIRGYRIEPGEIEAALNEMGNIQASCVLARKDKAGNNRLVGYIVCSSPIEKDKLEAELKKKLPDYMVPRLWVFMEGLPVTSNGKIDKKALPDPDLSELVNRQYVAPRNAAEQRLAGIWQQVLGLERVGVHDNFFELGGHSLLVTRLVSLIRREFSAELAIRDIFEYSTIASLAEHILQQSPGSGLPPITPVIEKTGRTPLSYGQERLWFIDKLQGSEAYHIPTVLKLSGDVDPLLLEKSFRALVERHEVLHTIIVEEEGSGYQSLIDPLNWKLEQLTADTKEELDALLAEHGSRPFVFSRDYMFRACLCKCKEDGYYYLSFVVHHIASDGWSDEILVKEFIGFYNAFRAGREAGLPALKIQYRDYAIWQRNYVTGDYLETQLQYWEKKLLGYQTLNLPADYSRPPVQSMNGANISIQLDEELCSGVKQLCRSQGVTLYMLLLSAFKVLLYRYSGQEDIVVGTPVANRTQEELEALIGFFVNTLVIRTELSGNMSFTELLQQVKATALEAYDHQEVPFEKIVDRVVKERDMSISPLFQVMFSLLNIPDTSRGLQADGITVEPYDREMQTAQFDLSLSVEETNEQISCHFNYSADLFAPATIGRMARHYEQLLRSVVQNSGTAIAALELVTREEKQQLLYGFNNTTVSYPANRTFLNLFEEQVSQNPDNIAVVFEDKQLTYRELDERSSQLALYLQKHGVKPDTLVPLCVDRSLEMITGILGILKAGCAYVPIDPEYPSERISYILEDTRATVVVTVSKYEHLFTANDPVLLDNKTVYRGKSRAAVGVNISAGSLAYVIYTSGTTGRPKGVMNQHDGLYNRLVWMKDYIGATPADNVLQKTTFCFDVSVWELLFPLTIGARLTFAAPDGHKDPAYLWELVNSGQVTIMHFVPSMLSVFLSGFSEVQSCGLRAVVCSGEELKAHTVKDFQHIFPTVKLYNLYGPTEAAIEVTATDLSAYSGGPVTIGKPIANVQIYIADARNNLQPAGVPGEILIGGIQVARGYLNKPELTAEKFIANPFDKNDPYKLYKTGDIGRWLPDGNIEYAGRKDDQVKIRGFRIELGEVEAALNTIEEVKASCVLARKDKAGNNRLVGYIVSSSPIEKDMLEAELKKKLPDYMVPQLWVFMEGLPVTANGKTDKKALPDPDLSKLVNRQYVAPRNPAEQRLAGIWQQVLGLEQVGVHDNFFELGGHSLLAVSMAYLVNKTSSRHLPLKKVFDHPTISELAPLITEPAAGAGVSNRHIAVLQPAGTKPPVFILPGIQGFGESYFELAKALGTDQPVYAVNMYGNFDDEEPFTNTGSITASMISWIKTIHPVGPFTLIGHSMGGAIAYEIMHQLKLTEPVKDHQLCFIDSSRLSPVAHSDFSLYISSLEILLDTLYRNEPVSYRAQLKNRVIGAMNQSKATLPFRELKELIVTAQTPPDFLETTNAEKMFNLIMANQQIGHNATGDLDCSTLLILSEDWKNDHVSGKPTPFTGWAAHLEGLQVDFSRGDHDTMVTGNNAVLLGKKIKKFIEHA